jgi:hypothetical protein
MAAPDRGSSCEELVSARRGAAGGSRRARIRQPSTASAMAARRASGMTHLSAERETSLPAPCERGGGREIIGLGIAGGVASTAGNVTLRMGRPSAVRWGSPGASGSGPAWEGFGLSGRTVGATGEAAVAGAEDAAGAGAAWDTIDGGRAGAVLAAASAGAALAGYAVNTNWHLLHWTGAPCAGSSFSSSS